MSITLLNLRHDAQAVASVETHMTKVRRNTYMVCEDMDLLWDMGEVLQFDRMWKSGVSLDDIAKSFGREADEVAVLVIDRARKGKIVVREGGAYGKEHNAGRRSSPFRA